MAVITFSLLISRYKFLSEFLKEKIHKVARNTSRRIPHEKNIQKSEPTSTINLIIDIISQFVACDPCFTTITFPRNRASFRFILRGIL